MKVLLTGASGFIGQHVANKLQDSGVDFVSVGRDAQDVSSNHIKADLLKLKDFSRIVRETGATHLIT